ncbi:hypothetical protein TPHA_0C02940 [Tetrapisispora phaffii CBS 4417]|uniref:Actin cytoskeleton-regulatory complex protein END3 n=1 Tax=Tetrapisispora phaffii (strain ATCC 24235 / CBS 4417 / NBRC 1672 / NRRL Y-8282 / UCD 70-5) TaxID=1071381 RepID=G8BRS1_TETPH|nr:hypothetical protein TPHA_0C02940 [Tetrapisispora phaffii CBS 4417]CCE62447.1 hypothetical protein TPHA_0C02940 [Tetrapisispora phaffii CBS 4417]
MPKLEQFEIKKYWQIFTGLKPVDNKVDHDQVLPMLYNSKLDSSILNQIWFLADIDDDDNLDFEEFVICMRLIFDLVNKNISSVPDELPDWLVPGSKAKLVKERKKLKQEENIELPKANDLPQIDWYISPEDKTFYDNLISSIQMNTDGTYTLQSISDALKNKFFNIGTSDINKAWTLVNPSSSASINKDPALYFIHILRQRNDVGALIPSEYPTNLESVINKKQIDYNISSSQNDLTRSSAIKTPARVQTSASSNNTTLQRTNDITINNNREAITLNEIPRGNPNDINSLEKELQLLDIELMRVKEEVSKQTNTTQIKAQLQELLNYKELQYQRNLNNKTPKTPTNLNSVRDDLSNLESQVDILESYLSDKKSELDQLNQQIQSHNQ